MHTRSDIQKESEIFKALGHPRRLAMVKALAAGEMCVCELRSLVDADMSTVSKHLAVLKAAGVVDFEKRGSNVYYRLVLTCLIPVFECLGGSGGCGCGCATDCGCAPDKSGRTE